MYAFLKLTSQKNRADDTEERERERETEENDDG